MTRSSTGRRPASALRRRATATVAAVVGVLVISLLGVSSATVGGAGAPLASEGAAEQSPAAGPASPRFAPLTFGVSMFAMWRDWDRRTALLDEVAATGTGWLRIDTGWCSLEEQGSGQVSTWYRDRLDTVIAAAGERGLRLLVMVGCAPKWAGGTTFHDFPDDPAEYQRVMTYLSARYRGAVAAWEIWNEPDCIGGCTRGSPAEYVPVLRAGFRGVRAGDPAATVVSGGVSGNNVDWLAGMYRAGAAGFFDVLATHPYIDPSTAGPDAPGSDTYQLTAVSRVHALMAANGDGGKPIWFTEFGWSTPGSDADRPGVDEATQAAYLAASVAVMRRFPFVTHAFWYVLRDRDDSTPYENAFGLLRVDGSRKPAFAAFTSVVERLDSR